MSGVKGIQLTGCSVFLYNGFRESARQPLGKRGQGQFRSRFARLNAGAGGKRSILPPFSWRKVRAPQGRVPGNAWEARAYGKCHRKYTAGTSVPVRVKWCGKSAPRVWQQTWQGKPHPEQDQIGEHSCGPHGSRVGCLRCTVTCIPDEWLSTTEPGLPAGSLLLNWPRKHTE